MARRRPACGDEDIAAGEAERRIDGLLLFATDIRVRGRTVSFGAPAAFLAGGQPDSGWSVTAPVTGAIVAAAAADLAAPGDEPRLERLALGAMQPRPGQLRDTFGHAGTSLRTPPAAPAESPRSGDIAARLRRLDELRAQGLLTEEEHREQRRRILGEL